MNNTTIATNKTEEIGTLDNLFNLINLMKDLNQKRLNEINQYCKSLKGSMVFLEAQIDASMQMDTLLYLTSQQLYECENLEQH